MILDMDTLYRIHSNEHSRYVTVRAHQHRHRPAPTPLANAQETIDFSLTLSGNSRLILKMTHSYAHDIDMQHADCRPVRPFAHSALPISSYMWLVAGA